MCTTGSSSYKAIQWKLNIIAELIGEIRNMGGFIYGDFVHKILAPLYFNQTDQDFSTSTMDIWFPEVLKDFSDEFCEKHGIIIVYNGKEDTIIKTCQYFASFADVKEQICAANCHQIEQTKTGKFYIPGLELVKIFMTTEKPGQSIEEDRILCIYEPPSYHSIDATGLIKNFTFVMFYGNLKYILNSKEVYSSLENINLNKYSIRANSFSNIKTKQEYNDTIISICDELRRRKITNVELIDITTNDIIMWDGSNKQMEIHLRSNTQLYDQSVPATIEKYTKAQALLDLKQGMALIAKAEKFLAM